MPEAMFEVGDRVLYSRFSTPEFGTVFQVNLESPKESPDALEVRTYDIKLDKGGSLVQISHNLSRAPE